MIPGGLARGSTKGMTTLVFKNGDMASFACWKGWPIGPNVSRCLKFHHPTHTGTIPKEYHLGDYWFNIPWSDIVHIIRE